MPRIPVRAGASFALLLAVPAVAQSPAETKPPAAPAVKVERAAPPPLGSRAVRALPRKDIANDGTAAAAPLPRHGLLHDVVDGALWTLGGTYKASFDGAGASFVPYFGGAPHNFPVHFAVRTARVGERELELGDAVPARQGTLVTFDHGGLRAEYELLDAGIEQRFVFDRLPGRGELRVEVAVATELEAARDGAGFVFGNDLGRVTFSPAIAVDAAGRRLPIEASLADGVMTFVVPAAFVAEARLPLVIDPVVGNTQIVYSRTSPQIAQRTDVAYEPSWGEYCVVHERVYSGTDIDVFAWRYSFDLVTSQLHVIDISTTCWERPAVAANNAYDCFLVVAQYSAAHSSPFSIAGRILAANSGALGPQFQIENAAIAGHASGDKLVPVVGGDMDYGTPSYFTVVWERAYSPTDHDIHMKQVRYDGSLVTVGPRYIDNSLSYDSAPAISKTDGTAGNARCWGIAFQRRYSPIDEDIYAAFVRWDGVVAQGTFAVDTSSVTSFEPAVSSPTDDTGHGSRYLFAYTHAPAGGNWDIRGTVTDVAGGWHASANLTAALSPGWLENVPCVDSDGARFVATFTQQYGGAGPDTDVLAVTYGYSDALGLVQQDVASPANSYDAEWRGAITSTHAAGSGAGRYAIAWTRFDATQNNGMSSIEVRLHDGMSAGGGVSTRTTSCGSDAASSMLGTPALGGTLYFQQTLTGGLRGFLFGLPASQPIGVCPGCTLGVDGTAMIGDFFSLTVPAEPTFVGLTVACQGFSFVSGPCLGSVSLDDTIDVTIR
jgi:hypothetical protein